MGIDNIEIEQTGLAWLNEDGELKGFMIKARTTSILLSKDLHIFYGHYQDDKDLAWIKEVYAAVKELNDAEANR